MFQMFILVERGGVNDDVNVFSIHVRSDALFLSGQLLALKFSMITTEWRESSVRPQVD